jgi:hypothetical protein
MPYSTRKLRGKNCYKVYNKNTKKVFSKCSTKKNAEKQIRLLRAIEFNKDFVPRSKMGGIKKQTYKKSK